MRMNLGQMTLVVGSVQQRKQTKVHKNWKNENKAVLVSVEMVKESLLKEYDNTINNTFNIIIRII